MESTPPVPSFNGSCALSEENFFVLEQNDAISEYFDTAMNQRADLLTKLRSDAQIMPPGQKQTLLSAPGPELAVQLTAPLSSLFSMPSEAQLATGVSFEYSYHMCLFLYEMHVCVYYMFFRFSLSHCC